MKYITAVPAYGRDYKSKRAVQEDWDAGKDFLAQDIMHSGYTNLPDMQRIVNESGEPVTMNIRYKRLTMMTPVVVNPEMPTEDQADDAYARRVMGMPPHPRNEPGAYCTHPDCIDRTSPFISHGDH
jgi:hypothetical protein